MLAEFEQVYYENNSGIDYITFSGSGEPTLHARIGEVITKIKEIANQPVAVITNGSLLHLPSVREELLQADLVMPSLDAVSESAFKEINRPHSDLELSDLIAGLERFTQEFEGNIWLEVFLAKGINDSQEELHRIAEVI